ncbi:MAG: hypothetical protein JNL88_08560 [Bacteroidia bacterium]|nr:hypothetical protein [Bacteroidia bacterium]
MKNHLTVLSVLFVLVILLRSPFPGHTSKAFHSAEEISFYKAHYLPPLDSGQYFSLPQNCRGCHGFDSLGLANVDINGMDINLYDDWETSMMGLAGVDPFWKAKVSHEILVDTAHSLELQTLCTKCHAPLGHYTAMYKGQTHYTMADLALDSLGQSGVSCHSCHGIKDSSILGSLFTGQIPYDTNRIVYGPFTQPMTGPMQLYVGLTPMFGAHLGESRACSPCHTLISNSVDLSGNPTGNTFVEQATYHEYLNSDYPTVELLTCQSCHMPKVEDPVKIANGYTALPGRTPFNLHSFAGANSFMVQLIKDNKTSLGVDAADRNFDSTLAANTQLLKYQTLDLYAHYDSTGQDTAYFRAQVVNKAGHKFPSGYPSRRAVLQFIALKPNGDTLFASGLFDNNYEVQNISPVFENHHNIIDQSSQSQIYEMVMGDVNGNFTTVLERANTHLKDNRIPPKGFSTLHPAYDTCAIVGDALADADFNKISGVEGSGQDIVHYHVPLHGYSGPLTVMVHVFYQTLPPGFLSEMQNYSSAAIDTFLSMYAAANRNPLLIRADTLNNIMIPVGLPGLSLAEAISIGPNPSHDGRVYLHGLPEGALVEGYTPTGQRFSCTLQRIGKSHLIRLPEQNGLYYLVIRKDGQKIIRKVVRTQ